MLLTFYPSKWLQGVQLETVPPDPTRMAKGIMGGIGFLGAGVIFKAGLSVRGLTTAASIWITAAIGILIGIGLFCPRRDRHHPDRPRALDIPLDRSKDSIPLLRSSRHSVRT